MKGPLRPHGSWMIAPCGMFGVLVHASSQLVPAGTQVGPRKADCTVVISANISGVLEPCGCQPLQSGGLARQAAAARRIRQESSPALFIDCGNLVSRMAPNKEVLAEARSILPEIGYLAGTAGPGELGADFAEPSGQQKAKHLPLVASSIEGRGGPEAPASVTLPAGRYTFELFTAVTPALVPPDYVGRDPVTALREPLRRAAAKRRIPILVSFLEEAELEQLLQALPQVGLVFSHFMNPDPLGAKRVSGAWVLPVPGSGKQLYRAGLSIRRYQITGVRVTALDLPPNLAPDPQVQARVRAFYNKRRLSRLSGPPTLSADATADAQALTGQASRECGGCHREQQAQWALTRHAQAWSTLREHKSNDRVDCIGCHTTPLSVASLGSSLSVVGCQTCHGDGFQHAVEPRTPSPVVRVPAEKTCRQCHTPETSPHFDYRPWLALVRH